MQCKEDSTRLFEVGERRLKPRFQGELYKLEKSRKPASALEIPEKDTALTIPLMLAR